MLGTFQQFMESEDPVMYITGSAGTGKTTELKKVVDFCVTAEIPTLVCAHTHKACDVLRAKLGKGADISTLHAFLKKRPTINSEATIVGHVEVSRQYSQPNRYKLLLIDEFSIIGEKDYVDINDYCSDEETGELKTKVVYIGDLNQLPPVKDQPAINPRKPWWVKLTKVWRQGEDNELLNTLCKLVSYIEGTKEPTALEPNANLLRSVDLVNCYQNVASEDKVILAFTNKRVQQLNADIQGREVPNTEDKVFSPTTRLNYSIHMFVPEECVSEISLAYGDKKLKYGSRYKTLEHLVTMPDIEYVDLVDEYDVKTTHAFIFGHHKYKIYLNDLKKAAVQANTNCPAKANEITMWAATHPRDSRAKARKIAWRNYLTFKDCVICLDFPYALTVHKSQGSTYDSVFLDVKDIAICADTNFDLYLRLLYVGISRSSNVVYIN